MPSNNDRLAGGMTLRPDIPTTSANPTQGCHNTQHLGQQHDATPKQVKFKGDHPDLKGHILDCHGAQAVEIYNKTIKQIATYVLFHILGREYKHGSNIKHAEELGQLPTIDTPANLDANATEVEREIWRKTESRDT